MLKYLLFKEDKMKILALQGSPRPNGYTQMVLSKFLEGTADKGAESEIIWLPQKKINACTGCYSCWFKHPGTCILQDDMPQILEKLRLAEVWVWATPLYHFGMTSYAKRCLERTLPLVKPWLIESAGLTTHPHRYPELANKKIVLISVCGFPEKDHFSALMENFRLLAQAGRWGLAGVLLRPGAETLIFLEKLGKKGAEVMAGFFRAGQEIVEKGEISKEVEDIVSQEWTTNRAFFREQANLFMQKRMEYEELLKKGEEKRSFAEYIKGA